MAELPVVKVSRKGALRAASGHPWIFTSDVTDRSLAAPGDAVHVVDPRGKSVGTAHYSSDSLITLRLLSDRPEPIGTPFLEGRIQDAMAYRRRVVQNSDAYRLVYSEADRLPGLIVDHYAGCLAVQLQTQGMQNLESQILDVLSRLLNPAGIMLRNDASVRRKEGLPLEKRVALGEVPALTPIRMNGFALLVDLAGGQKTGVFLDQRENYLAAANCAGGTALDCFTSSGGFALHMARRVEHVEAVDSSADALRAASANAEANALDNIEFRQADVFELLSGYSAAGRRFSTIVLDPPAFAKSRSSVDGALRGYKDINLRALRLLEPGGVLVTCSCSHHVSEADLLGVVAAAALDAGRIVRVRERRTQAQDHPILLTVPETLYLKCLILEMIG
ncbi:MAG: class I SAM-dependent rRNA methyltransferase [Acidobacteria bacterium]|nr:class I SAM-dependent rRNA methyltransferase [Acidobacteriota bacterium]